MSAICGMFRFDGAPVMGEGLRRMLEGAGTAAVWAPETAGQPVGLGSRLGWFTPEDRFERQPLHSHDGQVVLVADARIDNRAELASALAIEAEAARTMPDSAFILAAWEAWGEDCARRLLGDFVFALWDARSRSLFAARDAMGQRVLFFHADARALILATSVHSLLGPGHARARLDEQKLADFLVLLQDADRTFFADIRRLPAGHVLVVDERGFRVRRYWAPASVAPIRFRSDAEYVEAFLAVFGEAVQARVRCTGGVGVMMSAGLDSSSVAALAAEELGRQGRRLSAYHAAPRSGFAGPVRAGWIADESDDVRAIAAGFDNIDVWIHRPGPRSPLDCVDDLFRAVGGPIRNPTSLAWAEAIYARAAGSGVQVLLAGHKGNATISYTGLRSLRDGARRGHWLHVIGEIRDFARLRSLRPWRVFKDEILIPLSPRLLYDAWSRLHGHRRESIEEATASAINPDFAREMRVAERMRSLNQAVVGRERAGGDAYRVATLTSAADGPDFLQGYRDRFGVETRDPTCDVRVIDFCLSIPGTQYLRHGQSRWLIRRAMRGRLPSRVLDRATRGAQSADWVEWLPGMRAGMLADLARMENSATARRCLDLPRLRGLLERWPAQLGLEHYADYNLMLLRALELGRFVLWFEDTCGTAAA